MYSITDAHKALSCGRSTVYAIMKEAGIETTKSGLSQLMNEEQFQKLQEIYYQKYPNRKPKESTLVQTSTFKIDSETREVEVVESRHQIKTYQDMLEEIKALAARSHERDAETIADLRKQLEGKDKIIESLLEIIKNQKKTVSEPQPPTPIQRKPVKFPDYDPNIDSMTGDLFEQSELEQLSESSQNSHETPKSNPSVESVTRFSKPSSWQIEAFSEDNPPLTPDEAVIRYFKGRFPQRTPDMNDFLRYLESCGFPHNSAAASTRLAKLRRQQRAAREAGKI